MDEDQADFRVRQNADRGLLRAIAATQSEHTEQLRQLRTDLTQTQAFARLAFAVSAQIWNTQHQHTAKIDRLEDATRELKGDVTVLKADVAVLKTDVAVLKTDVSGLKADVSGLKADMTEVKADVAVLKTDVSGLKADVSDLKASAARTEAAIQLIGEKLDAQKPRWVFRRRA